MSKHSIAYVGNTLIAEVGGLRDDAGQYQNDAVVTIETIIDRNGEQISGIVFPVSLSYVGSSNGTYRAAIGATVGFEAEKWYTATFKAVAGSGAVMIVKERIRAQVRRA